MGGTKEEVYDQVSEIATRCRPPLSEYDIRTKVKNAARRYKPLKNQTIARDLKISVAEANRLGLTRLRPDYEYRPTAGAGIARREAREKTLLEMAAEHGDVIPLSLKELTEILCCSRGTARSDLKRLGLSTAGQGTSFY